MIIQNTRLKEIFLFRKNWNYNFKQGNTKNWNSKNSQRKIDKIILENSIGKKIICIAPGSIWNTKDGRQKTSLKPLN